MKLLILVEHLAGDGKSRRLLDWTEGALVALYFALCEPSGGMVWMLQPTALNAESELVGFDLPWHAAHPSSGNIRAAWQDDRDVHQNDFPVCVYPSHVHPRLRVQKSCFTVHGKRKESIATLMAEAGIGRFLKAYQLAHDRQQEMLAALDLLGISHSTLFPDLDGLAKDLENRFNRNPSFWSEFRR